MQEDSHGSAKADEAESEHAICSKGKCDSHTATVVLNLARKYAKRVTTEDEFFVTMAQPWKSKKWTF